jgi:hypothetical protein
VTIKGKLTTETQGSGENLDQMGAGSGFGEVIRDFEDLRMLLESVGEPTTETLSHGEEKQ